MSAFVDLSGLDNLIARLRMIERMDATLLMVTWKKIIEEDNRKGVLAGLDKNGVPMARVTYRPKGPTVKIGADSASRFRNNVSGRIKKGEFGGFGVHAAGLHNNLLTREYEQLTGPPLAPRGQFSRVITNLTTDFAPSADGRVWTAWGAWVDVVSTKGVPFLSAHFKGKGRLPKRDLRGVRPEGRLKARKALIAWAADLIRRQPTGYAQAG
jgi:hypothetical protein